MKTGKLSRAFFIAGMIVLSLVCPAMAEEVAVPDIETRIRNSGNTVPDTAVPAIKNPPPVALPAERAPSAPSVAPPLLPPTPPPASDSLETAPVPPAAPQMRGYASLGAGSPAVIRGELAVTRDAGTLPGFSIGFSHDQADGYGTHDAGDGFFGRDTSIDARVFGRAGSGEGSLSIAVADRTEGFQGINSDYFSMTHRHFDWDTGLSGIPLGSGISGLSASAFVSGSVYSSFAERPGGAADPVTEIAPFKGFRLSPRAAIGWARGSFESELAFSFGYETVADADPGEARYGDASIGFSYRLASFVIDAKASVLAEYQSDILFPFSVGISRDNPDSALRSFTLTGGLSASRISALDLVDGEPFARLSDLPYHAADWMAAMGAKAVLGDRFELDTAAEYRKTAYNRGILILADSVDISTGLVPVEYAERDSLATRATVSWHRRGLVVTGGISDEWLDRLNRKTLHTLDGSIAVFDTSSVSAWKASATASVPLDSGEYPALGAEGTVRLFRALALILTVDDILPLATGRDRSRNGLYTERGGALALSGRIDF